MDFPFFFSEFKVNCGTMFLRMVMKMKIKYWVLLVVLLALDYWTKHLATSMIAFREIVDVIQGLFYFTYVKNTGAAWSLLDQQPYLFLILASVASIVLVVYLVRNAKKMDMLVTSSFVFILAGTVGNLIDRIQFGYVRDFIGVYLGNYAFPIFNLADSFLVIGVLGYLLSIILEERKLKKGVA